MNGILLINKPENVTSSDVLNLIKKRFRIRKIGHSGTLDRFASGLLVTGINEGTKILNYITDLPKIYDTVFELGRTTDTLDLTGNVEMINETIQPDLETINLQLKKFIGDVMQVPPKYSAIKQNGERVSDMVREGRDVSLKPRPVSIYRINVKGYQYPFLNLIIECSKGTYIRAIARDLGELLGCGAYVKRLVRTDIPPFSITRAIKLDELLKQEEIGKYFIPLNLAISFMPMINLDEREKELLEKGQPIIPKITIYSKNLAALYRGKLFAVMKIRIINNQVFLNPDRLIFDR